jgi:signal transduction histidine kinase
MAVALAAVIGVFGYATGYEFHLSALFLGPVCWAGWVVGRRAGLSLALVCAVIWLAADLMTGHPYKHPIIPYWNALMLLAFFVVIVYSLSAFQDAHRKLEAARALLENQNERLEEAVRQRTAALEAEMAERKRLEQAHLQAERLAMVGTIAAQVAHEVRNPLGSITLNLDLMGSEIKKLSQSSRHAGQEALTLVNEMREEVRRIQRVIEDYLKFARLPKLQSQRLKLNEFLEQKLAFMDPTFQNAGVRLRTEFDAGLKTISADGEQIWQAILNLVQNSLEAMPTGGTLAVSTRRESGQALVRVNDTGKGMSEEQLKQVFVPFFTTKPRGTGLGLPLTQRILHEHGAQLECASTVGKGTSFTIHFPLKELA